MPPKAVLFTAYSCLIPILLNRTRVVGSWFHLQPIVTQYVALSFLLKLETSASSVLRPAQSILTAL